MVLPTCVRSTYVKIRQLKVRATALTIPPPSAPTNPSSPKALHQSRNIDPMPTLKIGNSTSTLSGLSLSQFTDIRDLLSYKTTPTKSYYGGYSSTTKYLIDKKGNFGSGLLYLVQAYFEGLDLEIIDTRLKPKVTKLLFNLNLPHTPYLEQVEAADAAAQHEKGILVAPTGFGKSSIIALIVQKLQVKTLIVVPSLELKKQLSGTLHKAFGSLNHITVENVDGIKIGDKTSYDLVIIDEYHHSAAMTYRKLNEKNWNGVYFKIGLSATPFRSQSNEQLLLESVLSQVIYEVSYQTAVDKNYIVPMEAFFIDIPVTKIKGNQKSWPSMYSELVVKNETRNHIIRDLLIKDHLNNVSTICLVKEIKHGEELAGKSLAFVSGQNDERYLIDAFNSGRINTLIGTDGILGEGCDTRPAEYIIIAGLGKSPTRFLQGCGRGFRIYPGKTSCKIIIFRDLSHTWTKKHFQEQCKHLKEFYNVVPTQLFI